MLNDTWYSRDLPVLTAIAEKLERGSAPVDTEQLIDELGLTRQDLMAALRALDVKSLIVRWPERITYRRSDPSTFVERNHLESSGGGWFVAVNRGPSGCAAAAGS